MRSLLYLLLLLTGTSFAQKSPVGLIIEFSDEVSFEDRSALINNSSSLKPLTKEHNLSGLAITLE